MFHDMIGQPGGTIGIDDDVAKSSMENIGAWIMGRNMFGPIRGPWRDHSWKGWWGPNPPYHVPVFVLTHHARPSIEMEGGTVFHFVTEGIEAALAQAKAVAGSKDIRIGGGASVIRQYLQARLIDELRLAIAPVFIGAGENLFSGLNLPELGYASAESVAGANATHVTVKRRSP
jgi:dihydrofolate reductase